MAKKASVSFVKGKGSMNHNNRDFITDNVDKDRIKYNINYKKESLEAAYEHCFGNAIEEYNAKQKRSDRKISGVKGYMEKVKTSGNGEKLFYENVIQVGNMFDSATGSDQGEVCKKILDAYMKEFESRNPNLYVFNAVLHMDEATPHLHIDYIPVAHGYTQGMSVRNSLDKALKEQGIGGKANKYENSTVSWQNREKDRIGEIMKEYGLERMEEKGLKEEHKSVEYYKKVAKDIHNQVKEMPKQIETAPYALNKERVSVDKKDLAMLEKRAKLSLIHEKTTRELLGEVKELQATLEADKREAISKHENMALAHQQEMERYLSLSRQQAGINQKYEELSERYEKQAEYLDEVLAENASLKAENHSLRASFEKRVEEYVEPFKRQIESLQGQVKSLKDKMKGVAETTLAVTNAVSWLKDRFKKPENKEICDAINKYSQQWLMDDGFPELAEKVGKAELSTGIKNHIKALRKGEFIQKSFNMDIYEKNGVYSLYKGDDLKKTGTLEECKHEAFLIDKRFASL